MQRYFWGLGVAPHIVYLLRKSGAAPPRVQPARQAPTAPLLSAVMPAPPTHLSLALVGHLGVLTHVCLGPQSVLRALAPALAGGAHVHPGTGRLHFRHRCASRHLLLPSRGRWLPVS